MTLFLTFINAVLGACLGSHACLIAERFGKTDFICSRSRCQSCLQELMLKDELPIISFLILKGKCRYCKSPIPARLFYAELLGAASFCQLNLFSPAALPLAAFLFSMLVIALQDWQTQAIDLFLLLPPCLLTLICPHFPWQKWDLGHCFIIVPIVLVMAYFIYQGKMGSADLLLTLITYGFWGSMSGTVILLLACLLFIGFSVCQHQSQQTATAFLPFLYGGQILYLLWA